MIAIASKSVRIFFCMSLVIGALTCSQNILAVKKAKIPININNNNNNDHSAPRFFQGDRDRIDEVEWMDCSEDSMDDCGVCPMEISEEECNDCEACPMDISEDYEAK